MRGAVVLLLAGLAGAAAPAGAAMRDFPLTGFDRIDLSGVAEVTVHTGAGFAVHADGDAEAVDALLVTRRGNGLVIGHKPGVHDIHGRVRVQVSMPRIAAVVASGAGSIAVDRVAGADLTAELSGTGAIRLPQLAVGQLHVRISGAGSAMVAGRADRIDLDLSGTGSIDAKALASRGGRLSTSGVGSIHAQADGSVDVNASGVGSVTVSGRPTCTIHRSGLGSVHCA